MKQAHLYEFLVARLSLRDTRAPPQLFARLRRLNTLRLNGDQANRTVLYCIIFNY